MANDETNQITGWVGWIIFTGVAMVITGILQFIIGLSEAVNNHWFVVTGQSVQVMSLASWGWVHMILGALITIIGLSLFSGGIVARTLAAILVAISLVANAAFIGVYPVWSTIMIVVDLFIIYALVAHGGEMKRLSQAH